MHKPAHPLLQPPEGLCGGHEAPQIVQNLTLYLIEEEEKTCPFIDQKIVLFPDFYIVDNKKIIVL